MTKPLHPLRGDDWELEAGFEPVIPTSQLVAELTDEPLRIEHGNIWDKYDAGWKIVITTNIGWDPVSGDNNMGAGLALQAASRWPWLPHWYGQVCRTSGAATPVVELPELRLVFFPVKPLLDPTNPERSWDQRASPELIQRSVQQLRSVTGLIALTYPGCGNGGLLPEAVYPLLEPLDSDRFVIVDSRAMEPRGSIAHT